LKNVDFREAVSTHDASWEQQTEAPAKAGTPFVLEGFSYSHHVDFYNQLARRFDLKSRFNPNEKRAWFRKSLLPT